MTTKIRAKNLVLDRATSHYSKSVGRVLEVLVRHTRLENWRTGNVEASAADTSVSRLAFACDSAWRTVKEALKVLAADGIITVNHRAGARGQDTYTVHPEKLLDFPSKFKARACEDLQ